MTSRPSSGPGRRRARAGAAALVLLLLVVAVLPPLRARAVAVAATAGALDLPFPRPLAAATDRRGDTVGGTAVDRYARDAADPTVVLVPGATEHGRDDQRVVRLAEAIARSGRTVLVPELRLYEPTLVPEDLDRIAAVVAAAATDAPVTVVGISYGGSLVLRTLGDRPELQEDVAAVVVFGAYADLVGVLQGAATGSVQVGDGTLPWEPREEAEAILRREVLAALPPEVGAEATDALAVGRPLDELSPSARAAVELLTHDDPDRTRAIVARLPEALRDRIRAVSPVHVAGRVRIPVRILHARDDPAVPYAEGLRLDASLPDSHLTTVGSFDHVDLDLGSPGQAWSGARDLLAVWRLVGGLLASQEPWTPARLR